MGRYLSIGVLGLATALSASFIPQFIAFVVALLSNFTPILNNTRGHPSLVMLLVICWSLRSSLADGFVWALVGGILLDLQSVLPIGTSSAALVLIVFVVNGVAQQLLRLRFVFLLAITAIATVSMTAYTVVALFLLGHSYDVPALIRLMLLPTLIYNLIAVLPLYAFVRLAQRRLEGGLQIAPHSLTLGTEMVGHE
ncbi:MAG: rod shape-determining protein MreD [Chloroflexi bacterium]|nr:rod shape-determining protein MreD [Chloroflexota bacterium]